MPAGQPAHVAIVEDDKLVVDILSTFLTHAGYKVSAYPDGESAVALLHGQALFAAIIDIGLPGISGYAVAQQLREQRGGGVLLLALTAHDTPDEIEMARYAGFNWHFSKPARPSLILEVLQDPGRTPKGEREGIRFS